MPKSRKPIGEHGQTLPELALVLFGFCVAVFVIVHTVVFCWNQVEIQRMAQIAGNDVAASTITGKRPYFWRNRLWGNILPAALRSYQRTPIPGARSYRGVSTHDFQRGVRLGDMTISAYLVPTGGWISHWLIGKQKSSVQVLVEPAIPGKY